MDATRPGEETCMTISGLAEGGGDSGSGSPSRHRGGGRVRARSRLAASAAAVIIVGAACLAIRDDSFRRPGDAGEDELQHQQYLHLQADGANDVLGIAASSSMWGVDAPEAELGDEPARYRRSLLLGGRVPQLGNMRPGGPPPGKPGQPGAKKPLGEPAILNDFSKPPLEDLDLDDVQEGFIWIPVAVNRFDPATTDALVKMCQVNYAKYSQAPWLLPMGGLLALNSGCADVNKETVQIVRASVLERILREGPVKVQSPTGFIFHETRCGSTLVANMLASVETNVMWSESTGPWKVMHTCPKCQKQQIVRLLKIVMDAMSRSAHHNQFYFKFQSSEDIDAVTSAFPDVPWIFIFREPVEVMMSRLGAQRIGMEGMEKEVAARVEKGMSPSGPLKAKTKNKNARENSTAQQLSGLCQKAIHAYEANPEAGMMVEYPHLPEGIVDMVLPEHFKVEVSPYEHQRMMNSTKMYSKVASFGKGTQDSKFTEDTDTKHDAASVAVTEAAQKFLYPNFYKLQSLQAWPTGS